MTTIMLDDDLIDKVVQIGNYQTPQEAVAAILSDYIKLSRAPKSASLINHILMLDMADGEIDSLFRTR